MTAPTLPILMYHEVSTVRAPGFEKYIVEPQAFAEQMALLHRLRFRPVTMGQVIASRAARVRLPRRPVAITFDDGFGGTLDHAVPVLERLGFTATFYLVSDLVGGTATWLRAERGLELPLFDWSAARSLVAAGFEIGSHTASHAHLKSLADEQCRSELEGSKGHIADEIGRDVPHLAYPFGEQDERVRRLAAAAGYESAVTVRIGRSSPADQPLALRRVPVEGGGRLLDFLAGVLIGRRPREISAALARRAGRLR